MNQGEGPRSKARPCIDSSRPMLTSVAYVCRRLTGHETRMSLKGFDGFQFYRKTNWSEMSKTKCLCLECFLSTRKFQ